MNQQKRLHLTNLAVGEKSTGWPSVPIILKTTNSGEQWQQQIIPINEGSLADVFFIDEKTG